MRKMKTLLQGFKGFLAEGQMSDYVKADTMDLYHYAAADSDSIVVDPKYFSDRAKRSSFSRNEYAISTVPRTFWYVDPKQRERFVATGRKLYVAKISANSIYDFRNDPQGYREKHRHETYGLRKGMEWNTMLEDISQSYEGIYYSLGFDVVSLFVPFTAARVPEEERANIEGGKK